MYQLGELIGKGAYSSVYVGMNVNSGQVIAVKQIPLSNITSSQIDPIMMEIDLLKQLNHPNIVQYVGFEKSAHHLSIYMEFCENGSLRRSLRRFGVFSERLIAIYISQVLEGLAYLHEQGTIHRDIKAGNILCMKNGICKLADFGIASKVGSPSEFSGSPYWMAPEVIELVGASTASDIWSLGCTTLELLQGFPPYYNLTPMSALFRIVMDEQPPMPTTISPLLKDFLGECFQKDPNLRVSARKLLRHPWLQLANQIKALEVGIDLTGGLTAYKLPSLAQDEQPSFPVPARLTISTEAFDESSDKKTWEEFNTEKELNNRLSSTNFMKGLPSGYESSEEDEVWDNDFENADAIMEPMLRQLSNETLTAEGYENDPFMDMMFQSEPDVPQEQEASHTYSMQVQELCMKLLENQSNQSSVTINCEALIHILKGNPPLCRVLVQHHFIMPIVDVLNVSSAFIAYHLLSLIEVGMSNSVEVTESLCLLGGIPILMKFADEAQDGATRLVAAKCIETLCKSNHMILQMFLSCGGITVLIKLLHIAGLSEEQSSFNLILIHLSIECISRIFSLRAYSMKNNFCRLLVKHGVLPRLSAVVEFAKVNISYRTNPEFGHFNATTCPKGIISKNIDLLVLLSQADAFIKEEMAKASCLNVLCDELRNPASPENISKALKCIKNVSINPNTLVYLSEADIIEILSECLTHVRLNQEQTGQAMHIIYNLCRINKDRQVRAIKAGIIPTLQMFATQKSPIKQFVLPILCELVYSGKQSRAWLYQHSVFDTYIDLLKDPCWRVNVLDSLCFWLGEDFSEINPILCHPQTMSELLEVFCSLSNVTFSALLGSLQKMLSLSPELSRGIAKMNIMTKLIECFHNPDAVVRCIILKIMSSIFEALASLEISLMSLYPFITKISEKDPAILVRYVLIH